MFSIFLQGSGSNLQHTRRILGRSMIKACRADLLPEVENQFWFIGRVEVRLFHPKLYQIYA